MMNNQKYSLFISGNPQTCIEDEMIHGNVITNIRLDNPLSVSENSQGMPFVSYLNMFVPKDMMNQVNTLDDNRTFMLCNKLSSESEVVEEFKRYYAKQAKQYLNDVYRKSIVAKKMWDSRFTLTLNNLKE